MANRSRPTHARNYGGGGNGGGLSAILGALVGAPGLEGGETIEAQGPPTAEGKYPTSTTPYSVGKPTLGQRIFNPRGVANSQQMADMLKFEDYQNQLKSGLLAQHGNDAMALERLRYEGDINEKNNQERIKKDEFARSLGLPDWEHAQIVLNDPDVQTAALKAIYADREKQGVENDYKRAQTQETLAGIPGKRVLPIQKDSGLYNPETGDVIFNKSPIEYQGVVTPGFEGGFSRQRLPAIGRGNNTVGGSFVAKPGGIAAEIGSFQPQDTYTGDDISNIGDVFSPYVPQKTGVLPTDKNTPVVAPISSTSTELGNTLKGLFKDQIVKPIKDQYINPIQQSMDFIKGMASTPLPSNFDTGRFQADFVDPLKGILNSVIGTSPVPTPNPNAYEDYINPPPVPPSLRPVIQPPSVLEEMRRRRQLLFPQPLAQPYYGR